MGGVRKIQTVMTEEGGEYIWPAGVDVVPVGEHGMPQRLIYKHEGSDAQPGCLIEIEVWEGAPVCSRIELIGKPDTRIAVRAKDLKELSRMVDVVIERAGVVFGFGRTSASGWGLASPGSTEDQRARLRSVRASRRKVTPAFLQQVADVYQSASAPRLEAVADAFGCSERSAARYVTAARSGGFIHE